MTFVVPPPVAAKARLAGADNWLRALPDLVADLAGDWSLRVASSYPDATEALVLAVVQQDETPAVLKLPVPRPDHVHNEIIVLRLAGGSGCARLLDVDEARGALLLERLGASLAGVELPVAQRDSILVDTAARLWRPAPDADLPTGAAKARWLAEHVAGAWDELDRPCSEQAVEHAVRSARRRAGAHDDERARLVHGDVHQWNALRRGARDWALVDPDGLLAEPEYDLGVILREGPLDETDPHARAHRLAGRAGLDAAAVWEWGVVERVSTGLLCTAIGLQPVGREMLATADLLAAAALSERDVTSG